MLNAETVPAQEGEDLRRDVHRHDDGCRYEMPPGQALSFFFFLNFYDMMNMVECKDLA
jgi:hypothetical protein